MSAGIGVGLGIPLLLALAGLLWVAARQRYKRPPITVPVASALSKAELHSYSSGPPSAYKAAHSEGSATNLKGRSELPIDPGYGIAEMGQGERL